MELEDYDITLTASEGNSMENSLSSQGEDMDVRNTEDCGNVVIQYGPETRDDWRNRLMAKLKAKFDAKNTIAKKSDLYNQIHQNRVIVDVDILLKIFKKCQIATCHALGDVKSWHVECGVLKVMWACSDGHTACWTSSNTLCEKKGQKIYTNTLLLAAGVLITGNNFEKISLLFKFLGIGFVSASTHHRIQRNYVVPEVKCFWEEMKKEIWTIINNEPVILCGDGRNDSPGHSAKYGTYVLMEQFLAVIVDIEVIDKRETGGISTNMEIFGLKKLLERIVGNLVVNEIVTDASPAVISLVRKMKGNYKKITMPFCLKCH